jgi:hypothetical protein
MYAFDVIVFSCLLFAFFRAFDHVREELMVFGYVR